MDKRAGRPKSGCDLEQLRELHAQGLCDEHIARAMGKHSKTIRSYREKLGLPRNQFDPRTDNGPKDWDKERARMLYDAGCSDSVLARELGIGITRVHTWRAENDLPPNSNGPFDHDRARVLYDDGLIDNRIAAALGVSRTAILHWREENGLCPNLERQHLDETAAQRLHDQGQTDTQIARALGTERSVIRKWRIREGLPSNAYHMDQERQSGCTMPGKQTRRLRRPAEQK